MALVDGDYAVTYHQLDERANAVARGLIAAGLTRGDRLAVVAPNSWQFVVTFFACAKTGIVFMPINLALSPEEVAFQLADSSVTTVVVTDDYLQKIAEAVELTPLPTQLLVVGHSPELGNNGNLHAWERLLEHSSAPVELLVEDGDAVHCLYTSGTTSTPKAFSPVTTPY
nr:AMP-binding protein [Rhodococcus opacus]